MICTNEKQNISITDKFSEVHRTIIKALYNKNENTIESYEIIAEGGTPLCEIYEILNQYNIDPLYSDEVMSETEAILKSPDLDDPLLEDFTSHPFVTIDNPGSRDLDQALYIEEISNGYRIYYALADASYYIKPDTALFDNALHRGASFYLSGMSVPMLPSSLSEGLISLNEGVRRRSVVFIHELDKECSTVHTTIKEALILSRAKLSYKGVQDFYDRSESPLHDKDFSQSLLLLKRCGEKLIQLGLEKDQFPFTRVNVETTISSDESSFIFEPDERNDASKYNEQLSLMCNREGAKILDNMKTRSYDDQPVFRIHDAPQKESLELLKKVIDELCRENNLNEKWKWDGTESLAQYVRTLPGDENENMKLAVEHQIRRSFQRSRFEKTPSEHYALGTKFYSRFSSPMREIVGIFLHKELLESLSMRKPVETQIEDLVLREKVIDSANRSKDTQRSIEREVERRAMFHYFVEKGDEDQIYEGLIVGVAPGKIYVLLNDPALEVKVYYLYGPLGKKKYNADLTYTSLKLGLNNYTLGSSIFLRVGEYDKKQNKIYFIPVDYEGG